MNKVIKVPLQTYVKTLCNVAVHVIIFALLAYYFLPEIQLKTIILIGIGFYVFKIVNYLVASLEIKDYSITYNGLFKRGILIPYGKIEEAELDGPSQLNSNYMLAFYSSKESVYENKQVLGRFPIFWFSRNEVLQLLNSIQMKNPTVQFHKKLGQYITKEHWKNLLINYLIQYTILAGLIIFIIMKDN